MWQLFLSLERSELNCYCLRETCIRLVDVDAGLFWQRCFYRAMLHRARYCYGKLSVRLSVRDVEVS